MGHLNGKRGGGRVPEPHSATQVAAQLAAYLAAVDGLSRRDAAQRAGEVYSVNPDNVRKYARRMLKGPEVMLMVKVAPHLRQLVGGGTETRVPAPFAVSQADWDAAVCNAADPPERD